MVVLLVVLLVAHCCWWCHCYDCSTVVVCSTVVIVRQGLPHPCRRITNPLLRALIRGRQIQGQKIRGRHCHRFREFVRCEWNGAFVREPGVLFVLHSEKRRLLGDTLRPKGYWCRLISSSRIRSSLLILEIRLPTSYPAEEPFVASCCRCCS